MPVYPFALHNSKKVNEIFVSPAGGDGREIQLDTSWHCATWKYVILCPFVRLKRGKVVKQWQVSVLLRVMWQSLPVFGPELHFPHIPRASLSAALEPTKESIVKWSIQYRRQTLAGCIATVQKGTFVWRERCINPTALCLCAPCLFFFRTLAVRVP